MSADTDTPQQGGGAAKVLVPVVIIAILVAFLVFGKNKQEGGGGSGGGETRAEGQRTIKMANVAWSSEIASSSVVKAVLEEKLGYTCEITNTTAALMYESVATGDQDFMVGAWLPTTQEAYYEKTKDATVDLGANLVGTKIGLVVPAYVTIDSITEMPAHADKFDGKIIGIDPGAGIMKTTQKAMKEYGLEGENDGDGFELVGSSGAAMTAALESAIDRKEWIVVTGWTPHWKFNRWDLKYLEDPKGIYGSAEEIHTIVRKGLREEMPEVVTFLDAFRWEPKHMQQLMVWNTEEGADKYANAKRWIEENPELVKSWLKDVIKP